MTINDVGQLLVIVIILYAVWQSVGSWLLLPGWFRKEGFARKRSSDHAAQPLLKDGDRESVLLGRLANWRKDSAQPKSSWHGQSAEYPCWQYISGVRRSYSFLRRKSLKRTRYNVTIVRLSDQKLTEIYFCVRPRRSLDSVDYLYAESEYSPDSDNEFSKLFFIETNSSDKLDKVLGEAVQQLLMQTDDVSLELINGFLVLVRITHILDLREHLRTERETVALVASYLEK